MLIISEMTELMMQKINYERKNAKIFIYRSYAFDNELVILIV